jgi:hypothetical protein
LFRRELRWAKSGSEERVLGFRGGEARFDNNDEDWMLVLEAEEALSKLFPLLAGGVSGGAGRVGMVVGRALERSVGRRAAGMYIGCRGV